MAAETDIDRKISGGKGSVAVLLAGIMVIFLLMFLVIGIDFARVYYVRGEMQNAADAGALAGASLLEDNTNILQTAARDEAHNFADANKAGGKLVETALNTCNDPSGDIVVGNWSRQATPHFTPSGIPVNAVKVVARRTRNAENAGISAGNNPVEMLFSKNLANWPNMNIVREATAALGLNSAPIPFCSSTCNSPTPLLPPITCEHINWNNPDPDCFPGLPFCFGSAMTPPGIAWTNFQPMPQTGTCPSCGGGSSPNPGEIIPFINGSQPIPDMCGLYMCTVQGTQNVVVQSLIDRWLSEKDKPSGTVTIQGHSITGWHTFLPVVQLASCGSAPTQCPGAPQPSPYYVSKMSEVVITFAGKVGKMPDGSECNWGMKIVGFDSASSPGNSEVGCFACGSLPQIAKGPARLVR